MRALRWKCPAIRNSCGAEMAGRVAPPVMRDAALKLALDLLETLPEEDRAILRALEGAGAAIATPAAHRLGGRLRNVLSLDEAGGLSFASREIAALFSSALAARDGSQADVGMDAVGQILAALEKGDHEHAFQIFERAGGIYFIHFHGLDACLDILNRFPESSYEAHETLTLALAMHALKSGNVNRAQFLLAQRFGDDMLSLERVVSEAGKHSVEVRTFRFVMAIYEDVVVSNELRERLFDLLAEFPVDDHLHRGSFYNAMLAVCLQRQELDAAEDIAGRAHFHYSAANAHLLVFYIEVHRVVFSLERGLLGEAERFLEGAREALSRVVFDAPADERLLALLSAVIDYEKGEPGALVRFVTEEFDKFAYGEIWPTVVELALVYCSQVLHRQIGLGAAMTFLERWRIQEWRSRRFNLAITMREVDILQAANRWQAAADRLMAVQSRINLTWVESAEEALSRLADPMEIELAMAWLRHLIHHVPRRPLLRDQLAALLRNDNVGVRARGRLQLWSAYLARMDRDLGRARRIFAKVLEDIARTGIVTHVMGDMAIINALLDDKRLVGHALASGEGRNVLRRLRGLASQKEPGSTLLTRQELRVLRLVAEGGTNKSVARQLRLSEVTVKFHLSNVYRKIGCRRRGEAISAARSLGWVD
jgi:DNA-binding CsgD family transcriptional regulator